MYENIYPSPASALKIRSRHWDEGEGVEGILLAVNQEQTKYGIQLLKSEAKADPKDMTVACTITTQSIDSRGDVVMTAGVDLSMHEKNPVVLFNHGRNVEKPIGRAVVNDRYTVNRHETKLTAVTKFSQSFPEAEQIFSLIEEGILLGLSIGATIDFESLEWVKSKTSKGWPTMKVNKCFMYEYSHTPCPINAEALVDRVRKGVLCGRPIGEDLKRSFAPWVPDKKASVTGGFDYEELMSQLVEEASKKVSERLQKAKDSGIVRSEGKTTEESPKAVTEIERSDVYEPTGSAAIRGVYDRLMELSAFVEEVSGREMSSAAQSLINEVCGELERSCEALVSLHRSAYPEQEQIAVPSDEKGDDYKPAVEKYRARLAAVRKAVDLSVANRRRMAKAGKQLCSDAAQFLRDASAGLPANLKDQGLIHAASLESIARSQDAEVTPEEHAKLKEAADKLASRLTELERQHDKVCAELRRARRGV